MTASDVYFEPWDPACREDLFERYEQLLERAPVYQAPSGTWVVSSYNGVEFMMTRPDLFTNFPNQQETMGFPPKIDPSSPEAQKLIQTLQKAAEGIKLDFAELFTARVIVGMDPPEHTRHRTLVNRGFTSRRIESLRPRIQDIVEQNMRAVRSKEGFDLLQELAVPLPVQVIAELFSVDPAQYENIKRWSDELATLAESAGRESTANMIGLITMLKEFSDYFVPLIQARRENPSDDLLSNLLKADGASVMSTTETVLFLLVVLAAGNETTTTLIGNTVVSLLRNRDQLELVVADPDLVVGALEESLRFEAPFQFMFKAPYEDVEIEGVRIPAGGLIAMMIGAANRDASRFTNPNRFDITRTTPHLGFGKGAHFCLGSALARMEAQIALRALVPELPNLELDETSLKQSPSLLIRGYSEINVTRR